MYLKLFLSFLSLIASALPSLWPYLVIRNDKILIATIALYSVLSAAMAFSTCTLTDSIGRHIANNERGVFNIGGALLIFIVGFMAAITLNYKSSAHTYIAATCLMGMSAVINSISEGVAKGVGKYTIHQFNIILSGLLFLLVSYGLLKLEVIDDYLILIALSRAFGLIVAFIFFFPLLLRNLNSRIKISVKIDSAHSFTAMSIVGYINLIIERFFVSKIAIEADQNLGKLILATYQSISVMSGARGYIFSNYVKLATTQIDKYFDITKRISYKFSIASIILIPIGAIILLKGDKEYFKIDGQYIFIMFFMVLSFVIDVFSSKFGIFYTYNKKDKINLVCEVIGAFVMIFTYFSFSISYEVLIIFVFIRGVQYLVRRVSFHYA